MVLAIPFLLGIMALMVCYRQRGLLEGAGVDGRPAFDLGTIFRRCIRLWVPYDRKTGYNDPRPDYWPAEPTPVHTWGRPARRSRQ